jgi:ATP-dependent DNA ligase
VIGLLEWSLPPSWRSKFDHDGYIPTLDTKAKLIENCEAIERNQNDTQQAKPTHKEKKSKSEKSQNSPGKRESGTNNKYCSEHGKNSTHNTSDCFTLKRTEKTRDKMVTRKTVKPLAVPFQVATSGRNLKCDGEKVL